MRKCECGSTSFERDMVRGEVVCNECGLVVEENILVSDASYVRFTSVDHSAELSLSTENPVNPLKVKSHGERRLEAIYHELKHKEVTQETRDRAMNAMRKYLRKRGKVPVHSLEDFVDAVVCLVCREQKLPYKAKAKPRTITAVGKHLSRAGAVVWTRSWWPEDTINRIVPELGLGPEVRDRAAVIAEGINRFTPSTRAALGVVIAARELGKEVDRKAVTKIADISISTLDKDLKELREKKVETSSPRKTPEASTADVPDCYFLKRLMEAAKLAEGTGGQGRCPGP